MAPPDPLSGTGSIAADCFPDPGLAKSLHEGRDVLDWLFRGRVHASQYDGASFLKQARFVECFLGAVADNGRMSGTTRQSRMTATGRNLAAVRKAFGLKQSYFVKYNVEQSRLSHWEKGKRPIDALELVEFCDDYDVSLDFIFRGKLSSLSQETREKVEAAISGVLPDPDA